MEHVNQLINIFTIYNCSMSVYYVWTIFIVLVLESLRNAFVLFRGQSLQRHVTTKPSWIYWLILFALLFL